MDCIWFSAPGTFQTPVLTACTHLILPSTETMAPPTIQKKTVLITGCSTGSIGWALTKCFLEHDYHVFAGVRSRSKAKDLAELSNVDLVELDVTVSKTILQCKELVAERTDGKLDVLVSASISSFTRKYTVFFKPSVHF